MSFALVEGCSIFMIFEKREEKKRKNRMERKKRDLGAAFHKFVFFAGAALAFKGLKGWMRNKRRR